MTAGGDTLFGEWSDSSQGCAPWKEQVVNMFNYVLKFCSKISLSLKMWTLWIKKKEKQIKIEWSNFKSHCKSTVDQDV